jgi:hypothetical protein
VVFSLFCHKHLEEATEQGSLGRLKALCKVKEENKFEARLKELEKILNDDGKA